MAKGNASHCRYVGQQRRRQPPPRPELSYPGTIREFSTQRRSERAGFARWQIAHVLNAQRLTCGDECELTLVMADDPIPAKGDEKATGRERMAKGWGNLRPIQPGEVRNKDGKNGHRARQELVAAILDEPDDDGPLEPGCSRIRSVVLATVRDAKEGGPGAGTAQKTCIEQYAGKAKQQMEVTGNGGGVLSVIAVLPDNGHGPGDTEDPEDVEPGASAT